MLHEVNRPQTTPFNIRIRIEWGSLHGSYLSLERVPYYRRQQCPAGTGLELSEYWRKLIRCFVGNKPRGLRPDSKWPIYNAFLRFIEHNRIVDNTDAALDVVQCMSRICAPGSRAKGVT